MNQRPKKTLIRNAVIAAMAERNTPYPNRFRGEKDSLSS